MVKGQWHTRVVYACPKCFYDVTQTLADRFTRCPECGEAVSESLCQQRLRRLGPWVRGGLCVLWMSPIIVAPLGTMIVMDVVLGPYRRYRAMQIGGVQIDYELLGWAVFGATTVACEAACYLLWYWVERWRSKRGAARRALWRAGVVLGIQVASVLAIAGTIWAYALWLA